MGMPSLTHGRCGGLGRASGGGGPGCAAAAASLRDWPADAGSLAGAAAAAAAAAAWPGWSWAQLGIHTHIYWFYTSRWVSLSWRVWLSLSSLASLERQIQEWTLCFSALISLPLFNFVQPVGQNKQRCTVFGNGEVIILASLNTCFITTTTPSPRLFTVIFLNNI